MTRIRRRQKIPLTNRQEEIFEFLKEHQSEIGYAPSVNEIAVHFGFTNNAARDHLQAIQKKGHIRIAENVARGIQIL